MPYETPQRRGSAKAQKYSAHTIHDMHRTTPLSQPWCASYAGCGACRCAAGTHYSGLWSEPQALQQVSRDSHGTSMLWKLLEDLLRSLQTLLILLGLVEFLKGRNKITAQASVHIALCDTIRYDRRHHTELGTSPLGRVAFVRVASHSLARQIQRHDVACTPTIQTEPIGHMLSLTTICLKRVFSFGGRTLISFFASIPAHTRCLAAHSTSH